jgi:hypothetical protein
LHEFLTADWGRDDELIGDGLTASGRVDIGDRWCFPGMWSVKGYVLPQNTRTAASRGERAAPLISRS